MLGIDGGPEMAPKPPDVRSAPAEPGRPSMSRRSAVAGDLPEEHRAVADLARVGEAGLGHQDGNPAAEVVPQALTAVEHPGQDAARPRPRAAEVEQVQGAAGLEHTPHLA